jgi:hypothetical protein
MQRSFEKNNLGTSQRGEYMKTIFGEEASSAAAVLMTAASSGKLDQLTAAFKASDGKPLSWLKSCRTTSAATSKNFSQPMRPSVLTCLTSRRAHCVSSPDRHEICLKLDGWIRKTGTGATIGIIAGGALAYWHPRGNWSGRLAGHYRH